MWRSKKFIVAAVLATVILVGGIGGAVLADDNGTGNQRGALFGALWDRVCAIYEDNTGDDIEPEALKDAFAQARNEMRTEAMQNRLQNLVDQGQITQEQADELQQWREARPDVPVRFGFKGRSRLGGCGQPCVPTE